MDDKRPHPNQARSGVLKAMDTARTDTQSKMMATALDMIGKQANLNFTIREFAKRAGVNLASVNYYFRSKENLISEIESLLKSQLQNLRGAQTVRVRSKDQDTEVGREAYAPAYDARGCFLWSPN